MYIVYILNCENIHRHVRTVNFRQAVCRRLTRETFAAPHFLRNIQFAFAPNDLAWLNIFTEIGILSLRLKFYEI